jgi:hypothetical protein
MIPQERFESINVAMAGTIFAYESYRSFASAAQWQIAVRSVRIECLEGGAIAADDTILAQISRDDLRLIYREGLAAVTAAADLAALEAARIRFLGRKADLVLLLRTIPELPAEQRPEVGKVGNLIRKALEKAVEVRRAELEGEELLHTLERDQIDVTLPGRHLPLGHLHLVTRTRERSKTSS